MVAIMVSRLGASLQFSCFRCCFPVGLGTPLKETESLPFAPTTTTGTTALNSLTPKNWQLPTNTNPTSTGVKSYANLTKAHGIESNEAGRIALGKAPLYFVRSGSYYYSDGNISSLGSSGRYWSSTASNAKNARILYAESSTLIPQY